MNCMDCVNIKGCSVLQAADNYSGFQAKEESIYLTEIMQALPITCKDYEVKLCTACRSCECDSYNNVRLVPVRNPEANKIIKRAYLCIDHRAMYAADGNKIYF